MLFQVQIIMSYNKVKPIVKVRQAGMESDGSSEKPTKQGNFSCQFPKKRNKKYKKRQTLPQAYSQMSFTEPESRPATSLLASNHNQWANHHPSNVWPSQYSHGNSFLTIENSQQSQMHREFEE